MNITESIDQLHRVLAPLASSETFSDVTSIYHDEPQKKDLPIKVTCEEKPVGMGRNNDFDSLEILFDFPSNELKTDSQANLLRPSQSPSRIRFSETPQIITSSSKV